MRPYVLTYQRRVYTWTLPGQPTPAPRLTQARKFDPRLSQDPLPYDLMVALAEDAKAATITRGYYAFKLAVRAALLDAYPGESLFPSNILAAGWPFILGPQRGGAQAILDYALRMASTKKGTCRHGDPDNIVKAVLDALFRDDRHVLPRCQSQVCGVKDPGITITVTLLDERTPPHVSL